MVNNMLNDVGFALYRTGIVGRLVVFFLVLATVYVSARYVVVISQGGNSWTTGDWLIHYGSGFVRRGLSGSVTFLISDLTGVSPLYVAALLQILIYIAMVYFVLVVFLQVAWTGPVIMLLVSPVFLLMQFYYLKLAIIKEVVGYLGVAMIAAFLASQSRFVLWAGVIVVSAAGFVHEINVFLLPAALALIVLFMWSGNLDRMQGTAASVVLIVVSASAAALSVLYNGNGLSESICAEIIARVQGDLFCKPGGPVMWLDRTTAEGFAFAWDKQVASGAWPMFLAGYFLAILPWAFFRLTGARSIRDQILAFVTVALGVAIMFPLFVVASDWGRWISMYVFSLTLLTVTGVKLGLVEPRIQSSSPIFLIYGLTWSMPDFSGAPFTFGLFQKLYLLASRVDLIP